MPGDNNFKQWNGGKNNQESDADYLADAMRIAGAVNGIFPTALANKLFYQLTTFSSAFGEMMKAKGYSVSDADITTLITVLANVLTRTDEPFGAANLTQQMNDAGTSKIWGKASSLTIATRDMALATGNISYTGAGFRPTIIVAMSLLQGGGGGGSISVGFNNFCGRIMHFGSTSYYDFIASSVAVESNYPPTAQQLATIVSFDSDGHTFYWVTDGSPSGILYMAFLNIR